MLAHGAVNVYSVNQTGSYPRATITASACTFNIDDAIALWNIPADSFANIFGSIGHDPGSQWISTSNRIQNRTLIRKSSVMRA